MSKRANREGTMTKTYDIIGRYNINKPLLDQLGAEMATQPKLAGYCRDHDGRMMAWYEDGSSHAAYDGVAVA